MQGISVARRLTGGAPTSAVMKRSSAPNPLRKIFRPWTTRPTGGEDSAARVTPESASEMIAKRMMTRDKPATDRAHARALPGSRHASAQGHEGGGIRCMTGTLGVIVNRRLHDPDNFLGIRRAAGFLPEPSRLIPDDEHVGVGGLVL